jgi:hypothetical protein
MESLTRNQCAVEILTADDISGAICSYEMCVCYVSLRAECGALGVWSIPRFSNSHRAVILVEKVAARWQ